MTAEPTPNEANHQSDQQQGINLEIVYRSLLRIVSCLDSHQSRQVVAHEAESQYTQGMLRQTTERELDDLANPASDTNTSQG